MKRLLLSMVAITALAWGNTAHADLIITAAGGSTGDVVQFEAQYNNQTSFFGDTNKGANTVQFLNLNQSGVGYGPELIGTTGQGQADVICTANCGTDSTGGANGSQLTGMEIKLPAPIGATTEIFNLDFGEGTVEIVAQDNFGNVFTDTLTQGSNFFRIDSVPGSNEVITDTKIFESPTSSSPFGWNSLKQPRIVACTIGVDCNSVAVPEPSTLALFGGALLGLGLLHSRRKRFIRPSR